MKKLKNLGIGLAVLALVVFMVIYCVPSWHRNLIGVTVARKFQQGRPDDVSVLAQVLNGNEIRGLTNPLRISPNDSVVPLIFDLSMEMREAVDEVGDDSSVLYGVTATESKQIGNKGAGNLVGNKYWLHLPLFGYPSKFYLEKGSHPSQVLDEARMQELLANWWPAVPKRNLTPGFSWSDRWDASLYLPILDSGTRVESDEANAPAASVRRPVLLRHTMNFKVVKMEEMEGMEVAKITFSGSIAPQSSSALPKSVGVYGQGHCEGELLVNIRNGYGLLKDERTAWFVMVRMEDQGVEYVEVSDCNSRIFRPRLVPDGAAGFEKTLPKMDEESLNKVLSEGLSLPTGAKAQKTAPSK